MSRLSYKTLFIILLFLLIPIVFLLRINQKSKKISAAWWDEMWHYRQAINISSHSSTESNVYITTTINIDNSTKAQADDGDFRFTNQTGNLLPYYISAGTGTTSITFHINFDSFPAGAQTIYAYYGNPSANNGFSVSDFSTAATNYTIGSLGGEEIGGAPVAYWKFDEGVGTTLYNSNSNQNNGYFNSPSPLWADETQCINGKCLSFDGTQSAFSNYDLSWNNTNSISLSFWVKPQNTTDSQRGILGKQYSLYEWSIYQSGSSVSLVYWNTAGGHTNGMDDTWGNVLKANKWTHLVYTWDGSTSRFYANGRLVKTKTAINPSINMNRTNNMMFGGNIYTWGNTFFRGLIDEVKIYNYLRTAEQIKQEYVNHGSSVNIGGTSIQTPPGNLVAHYKFNENNGSSIHDSINNATGTVYNGATWVKTNLGVGLSLGGGGSNDYISLSNQPLNNATVWSISTELKYIHLARVYEFFLGQNDQTTGKILLGHNGYISFRGTNGTYYDFSTTSAEINNLDSNLIFISNGTTIKLYIDGIYKSSIAPASTSINIDSIGNAWTDTVWTSAFVINELKIYNTALTDDQIKQDYNRGSSVNFSVDKLDVGSTSAFALYCVPGSTDPCSPPVAEWKFEEGVGTTVYDTSGNNNNVSLVNTIWSQGKIGKSLSFNGSSSVLDIPDLSFPGQFTYSFWINNESTDTRMWFSGSSNQKFGTLGGKFFLRVISSSDNTVTFPSLNGWHYITLSRDANNKIDLFIDNNQPIRLFGDVAQSGTTYLSVIGRANDGSGQYYQGKLDQIRIYNYARTPAQIAWDYNQGAPIGWWKFDECQGSIAHDSSGIGNTGAISIGGGGFQTSVGTCNTSGTAWGIGATGKFNSSLNFDGTDDYITVTNSNSLKFGSNDFSISMWTFRSGTGVQGGAYISKGGYIRGFDTYDNIFRVNTNSGELAHVNLSATLNTWENHIFVVSQSSTPYIKHYINGIFNNSGYSGPGNLGTFNSDDYDLLIGKSTAGGVLRHLPGQIDDVRIYNYSLTSDQIKQIYNGGAINFN